jgi:hypothetical protein
VSAGEVVVWCVAIFCATVLIGLGMLILVWRSVEKKEAKEVSDGTKPGPVAKHFGGGDRLLH